MTRSIRAAFVAALFAFALSAHASPAARPLHVALLGDSLAYGAGDETGKGIAGRLQPELRSHGIEKVSTTNLGVTGATTGDVAAKLRKAETRAALARAGAIVLSAGANDLRRQLATGGIAALLTVVDDVLRNMTSIVTELHRINPDARIIILGAYAPIPDEDAALLLEPLVAMWDATLAAEFDDDPLVSIVRFSDIVDRPEKLSKVDSFHPGGEAYQEAARRIAGVLAGKPAARKELSDRTAI